MPWFVAFGCAIMLPGALLHAQVPQLLNYQGRVAVGTVNPVNFNGTGTFKFALVNPISVPVPTTITLWSNNGSSVAGSEPTVAVSLPVTKGLYSVLLGDTTVPGMTLAIPTSAWLHPDVRLRVWFNDGTNGSQLLTPDQRLAPNGYLPDGSVSSAALASGAVTSVKLASGLTLGGTTTGTFSGNLTGTASTATTALSATSATTAANATNFTGALAGNVTGPQAATVVATVGGVTAANVATGTNLANAATLTNTPNTIVKRDASGNFSAGTITGTFSGSGAGLTGIPGSALGSSLSLTGTLNLPTTTSLTVGVITQNGFPLLHTYLGNFFAANAGNFTMAGSENIGIGHRVLETNTSGSRNIAIGREALSDCFTSTDNIAIGRRALQINNGSNNIAVGNYAGSHPGGSDNIFIGHSGAFSESGIIRIGRTDPATPGSPRTPETQTDTYLAGVIHGDTTRFGSGAGTGETPDRPLIIRRANSTNTTAGQVVARTDKVTLERDGSNGGWRISYLAFPGNTTIAFTGLTATGATMTFVTSRNSPGTAGTFPAFGDEQNLIWIRGTFGDAFEAKEQTEVSLMRYPGDSYWIGTITSTFNQ